MPRRTFFRSAIEKKHTKKHLKHDQKIQAQQHQKKHLEEPQLRQLQEQHGQVDNSHAAFLINLPDPPPNLDGPAPTASNYPYSGGDNDMAFGPNYASHNANKNGDIVQVQERYGPYQRQSHQNQDEYDYQHNAESDAGYDQILHHNEYTSHQDHLLKPENQYQLPNPQEYNMEQHNVVPTVESATNQMWQYGSDDFRSGSLAIQLLRLAVITDWEKRQQSADNDSVELTSFPYDPSETFLSLQGAALRFHANFNQMKAGRDAYAGEVEGPDSLEWELTEQTAWEVWEESLRATAALAHASVGPGWRTQLQLRRKLKHETEIRSMYGSSLHQRNQIMFDDFSNGDSSLGSYSFDISNPPSSDFHHRNSPLEVTSAVDNFRIIIPEVLPAAMIRFAASVIDCTPVLHDAQTKIIWKEEQTQQQMNSIILQHINDERRWIRRMKRLGDTQRDLAFALFCVDRSSTQTLNVTGQEQCDYAWSIPRSHCSMATMICSWLTLCTIGWPIPKTYDEVPCRFEDVSAQYDTPDDDETEKDTPPFEIVFPVQKNRSNLDQFQSNADQESEKEKTSGIQTKYSYWRELVDITRKDWWYTLRVLRDCSDLVSSGWCPPPSSIGNQICILLVEIAMNVSSSPNDGGSNIALLPDEEICRGSCAAESLALLKNLASRDLLPPETVDLLAKSLCRLLSESEKAISDQFINDEEMTIQRTFIASNSAELLWILLSNESTCCSTCDALFNLIDNKLADLESAETNDDGDGAVSSVRALSAALWGDPPAVQGIPLMRCFWGYAIDLFGKALNVNAIVANNLSISFAVEIVLALKRLVDSEMVYGNGVNLHPTEYESFINSLDVGISPWFSVQLDAENRGELFHEISVLFAQIKSFLAKVPEIGFHPIIDEDARYKFHIHILRECAPRLNADEASGLSLAVIKSWSCSVASNLPCRDGKWLNHATSFISEAFAMYDGVCFNSFPRGFVHSPLARLEALNSLISDCGGDKYITDTVSVAASAISAVTSGTGLSGTCTPMLSLFTVTRNLRDMHLELINKLLLPQLISILAPAYQRDEIKPIPKTYLPLSHIHSSETDKPFDYAGEYLEAEFFLLRYAVRVVGLLFKSRSGDGDMRRIFIDILKYIAMSRHQILSSWNISNQSFEGRIKLEIFRLQLEAIRQLEICLRVPFRDLPHTHGAVPTIVNALLETVTFYSSEQNIACQMNYHTNSILCLAAIIPLARLSSTRNGFGIFLPRKRVTRKIPDDILSLISDNGWTEGGNVMIDLDQNLPMVLEEEDSDIDESDNIAAFVYVKQAQTITSDEQEISIRNKQTFAKTKGRGSIGNDKTFVDIDLVATVIKKVLCMYQSKKSEVSCSSNLIEQSDLSPIIRIVCLDTISSFLSHGISFPNADYDKGWLLTKAESAEELISKSQAVSLLGTVLGNLQLSKVLAIHIDEHFIVGTVEVLAKLATEQTEHPVVVQNACCGLVTLLVSMRVKTQQQGLSGDISLTDILTPLIQHTCHLLEHNDYRLSNVLIPLTNVTRACISNPRFNSSRTIRRQILLVCLRLKKQISWYLQVILFFTAAEVIDTMSIEDDLDLFLAVKFDRNSSRIQPLLLDTLRCKILYKRLYYNSKGMIANRIPMNVHIQLARKTLAIDAYPFQADGVSTWKCGGSLLTIRVGSRSSLYCGWVEIVLRSTACTLRRLVRVDKEISATDPENSLTIWNMLRDSKHHDDADTMENGFLSQPKLDDMSRTLLNARNVIEHFDEIIHSDSQSNELEQQTSTNNDAIMSDARADSFSSNQIEQLIVSDSPVFKPGILRRNKSDGNIVHHTNERFMQADSLQRNDVNIRLWIKNTFGNYLEGGNVLEELCRLGFSSKCMDATSTTIESNSIYHDKLKSCTIGNNFTRALNILDRSTPFQTHRVSLLYGGSLSQKVSHEMSTSNISKGDQFLLSTQAPTDFWKFAKELGDLVPVRHLKYFSGGLDTSVSSSDGAFAIVWFSCKGDKRDCIVPAIVDSMVIFHTVTLMPNKITNRKRHIGNDIVHIIYGLESETLDVDHEEFAISGQFGFVTIYVIPFVCIDMVKISIHLKKGLDETICSALSHLVGSRYVSRKISAEIVRSLAQEADLICLSMIEEKLGLVLNIEERAVKINDMNRHIK